MDGYEREERCDVVIVLPHEKKNYSDVIWLVRNSSGTMFCNVCITL